MPSHKLYLQNKYSPSGSDTSFHMMSQEKMNNGANIKPGSKQLIPIQSILNKMQKMDNKLDTNHPALLPNSKFPKPGTSKEDSDQKLLSPAKMKKPNPDSSDDDFDVDTDFFQKLNQKIPYSYSEDEMILKFVLKGANIRKVSSISLWKYLETKKTNPKRTHQSLKNRFLRNIKPNIFKTFRHLIADQETVDKILKKFPELKQNCKDRDAYPKRKSPEHKQAKFTKNEVIQSSDTDSSLEDGITAAPVRDCRAQDDVNLHILSSSQLHNSSSSQVERMVTFHKETIKTTVKFNKSRNAPVGFSSEKSLSERFKKVVNSKKRSACPTCGHIPTALSESDAECDTLIPNSMDYVRSRELNFPSNSNTNRNTDPRMNSQRLLISLEKSDKFNENSEESNGVLEDISEKDINEADEIIEIFEMPIKEDSKTNSTNSDSGDINLIYENTVARFHKIIDADEEKTLQRKCLNKNKDSIGFDVEVEKNIDSFFLETPSEAITPFTDNVCSKNSNNDNDGYKSERELRSRKCRKENTPSGLASNMMKMLKQKSDKKK